MAPGHGAPAQPWTPMGAAHPDQPGHREITLPKHPRFIFSPNAWLASEVESFLQKTMSMSTLTLQRALLWSPQAPFWSPQALLWSQGRCSGTQGHCSGT